MASVLIINQKGERKMIEGKVIKEFNDKQNNLKKYTVGKKFKEESQRYNELKSKGFVDEGKEVATKSSE